MNQKERMLAELPYKSWLDGLAEDRLENAKKVFAFNNMSPELKEEREAMFRTIVGKVGNTIFGVESPFRCDYGYNIEIGENFYTNLNCVILDVGKITIGNNVMFGPNVSLYGASHPLHPDSRNSGYEYGLAITIGNNVWLGGSVVVCAGVTIGDNCVIGAGSVVTKDIPENSFACGNPCRVKREITEDDRDYYCRGRKFDVEDYK